MTAVKRESRRSLLIVTFQGRRINRVLPDHDVDLCIEGSPTRRSPLNASRLLPIHQAGPLSIPELQPFTSLGSNDLMSRVGGRNLLLSAGVPANERTNAMNATTVSLDQTEEEILAFDVSDEALESTAAETLDHAGNYTFGSCTGLSVCPA
jgi:hypothetical protein